MYFENLFREQELNWKEIYILPWRVSLDCNVRSFQYKVLNNVLYLNKKLFIFGKSPSSLCSLCKQADQTILRLFYECNITKESWNKYLFFNDCFHLLQLLPQTTFFLDSLMHILITLYLKIIFFYFLKFICTIPESKRNLH